jgi:hypothetical protein
VKETRELHVGALIWFDDPNRRVYTRTSFSGGKMIRRESFRQIKIIGETGRSWIIDPIWHGKTVSRIPKKGPLPHRIYLTQADVDDVVWRELNQHRIAASIPSATVEQLRTIQKLLGLQDAPER